MMILLMGAKQGQNVLFCMLNRIECILLVTVMVLDQRKTGALFFSQPVACDGK
jgi:hypothetical protein